MIVFFYIALVLFGIVFFQDITQRAIWWFLPLAIFVAGLLNISEYRELAFLLYNVIFVCVLMLFLTIYIKLRFKKNPKELLTFFGLGDILILLSITPFFSFNTFIYVFTFGTCFSILTHLTVSFFRKQKTVPYAGYLSIFVALFLLVNHFNILNFNL